MKTIECPYCYTELIVDTCDTIECSACESTLEITTDENGNFEVEDN